MISFKTEAYLDSRVLDTMLKNAPKLSVASTRGIAHKIVLGCRRRSRVRSGEMKAGWTKRLINEGGLKGFIVYNDVPWTIYNELGTSKMSAQPMLTPSFVEVRASLPIMIARYMTISGSMDLSGAAQSDAFGGGGIL